MTSTPALPTATDEDTLVQRLLSRDERALRLLHDRYAKNLLLVIVRLVRDEALAQDVLQEGLLKVWLSIDRYDATRGRLFTWMVRVCCNQAIDAMRSPRNRFHNSTQVAGSERGAQRAHAPILLQPRAHWPTRAHPASSSPSSAKLLTCFTLAAAPR